MSDALRAELRGSGLQVSLVVLGMVESSYWVNNPGSRQNVPKAVPGLMPVLSTEQAAAEIVRSIEGGRRLIVRPAVFRLLFLLSSLFPDAISKSMRKA